MFTLFLFCAVIAGSIFVLQFVLLLIGFGGEGADFDTDVPDLPDGVDGDFDVDFNTDGEFDSGEVHDHGSTWLFGVISLRTVVAAVTFFGLAGLTAVSADQGPVVAFPIAIGAGALAMFGVHFLMRSLHKLSQDGKLRIRNAVGKTATVYVPIPAHNKAAGKIQIRMQGRLEELLAMCGANEDLSTGTKVRVVSVVSSSTVQVEPIHVNKQVDEAEEKEQAAT